MTDLHLLKPYKSFIFAESASANPAPALATTVLQSALDLMELNPGSHAKYRREIVDNHGVTTENGVEIGFFHYRVHQPPSWTLEAAIEDTVNHLFLVLHRNNQFAFVLTESPKKDALQRMFDKGSSSGLGALRQITRNKLNSCFVTGETRTLWLSGTHRRTTIKPDSKILSGLNLRDALDPLADQSYYFTSARSLATVGTREIPVGCSPRNSRVWTGLSTSWLDFEEGTVNLMQKMDNPTVSNQSPLPVVATPVMPENADITRPFDMAFMPPGFDDPTSAGPEQEEIELWSYHSRFTKIRGSNNGRKITADLYLRDTLLGTVELDINVKQDGSVEVTPAGTEYAPGTKDDFLTGLEHARKRNWLKIWYESGLTVTDGQFYSVRLRDFPYKGISWVDFAGKNINISHEKPKNPSTHRDDVQFIGQDTSLFDWTFKYWPNLDGISPVHQGWLACDDGAMEIADFIHINETANPKILSLIHVKASKTSGISVSDYEVVGSQAVKNLRSLDEKGLIEGLKANLTNAVGKLVWHDGTRQINRSGFIAALDTLGSNYQRQVVLLQPSLSRSLEQAARDNKSSGDYKRLQQLDTLLLGIEANCHSLSATLQVIGNAA